MVNSKHRPQILAREAALKVIFQLKFNETSFDDILNSFVEKRV